MHVLALNSGRIGFAAGRRHSPAIHDGIHARRRTHCGCAGAGFIRTKKARRCAARHRIGKAGDITRTDAIDMVGFGTRGNRWQIGLCNGGILQYDRQEKRIARIRAARAIKITRGQPRIHQVRRYSEIEINFSHSCNLISMNESCPL